MPPKCENHENDSFPLDMLSSLPKILLEDVLQRLPLRDVVRTSILSKSWRFNTFGNNQGLYNSYISI